MNRRLLESVELIRWSLDTYKDKVALASSFGVEDMVALDLLSRSTERPRVFTLDTGRLHPETYDLLAEAQKRYRIELEVFFPQAQQVEEMVREKGMNLFYDGVEERKLCCRIRKVEPLQRALSGLSAWMTGLRREQSPFRSGMKRVEEEPNGRVKISPLLDWTENEIWQYVRENDVPYNRLHDQGFPSIGCAPCTRAIKPGEDPRAGRWWWEASQKECGLHAR